MNIRKKIILTIILCGIAVAAIVAIWYFGFFSIPTHNEATTKTNTTTAATSSPDNSKTSDSNNSDLAKLQGDAFDEAFIAAMLAHHDGAVNMAEQAQAVTAHDEIRTLAGDITMTQGQEIASMRDWQKSWGYKETMSGGHMSHGGGGMDMAGDMVEMQNTLKDLTGEAYDKEFLKQMIIHHEQAIEMAKPAITNAKHAELKQLAQDIIKAQTREIQQMKQWQKDWGYAQ